MGDARDDDEPIDNALKALQRAPMDHRRRIAIAGFQHETNTFNPTPSTLADFEDGGGWPALTRGAEMIATHRALNIPIGGFITAAEDETDIAPILWTNAEPGGVVTADAFERICGWIVEGIVGAGEIDGVYLDLHGAMVSEAYEDGEAEIARRVRATIGPEVPFVISLDLHANIGAGLVDASDFIAIYRTYPHLDMDATGARCWAALREMIGTCPTGERHGERRARRRPAKAYAQVDHLIPLSAQCTEAGMLADLYASLPSDPARESADVALGFPMADAHDAGPAVVAYARDQAAADALARALANQLAEIARALPNPLSSPDDAVRQALAATETGGTAVISDVQDNSGAGALSNGTAVMEALLDAGAIDAIVGAHWDPDLAAAAHQAGVGGEVLFGDRKATVKALSDGVFTCLGAMQRDVMTEVGLAALVQIDGVGVVVTSHRHQAIDRALFTHLGVDLNACRIVVVKSTIHFRADFAPIAMVVIPAKAPGLSVCDMRDLSFARVRPQARPR